MSQSAQIKHFWWPSLIQSITIFIYFCKTNCL